MTTDSTERPSVDRIGIAILGAALSCVVGACSNGSWSGPNATIAAASFASDRPAGGAHVPDQPATELMMVVSGITEQLTVSEEGSVATLLANDGSKSLSLAFDYRNDVALLATYTNQTYTVTTLETLVQSVTTTRQAFADSVPPPAAGTLKRASKLESIAGLKARLYETTVNGVETRLWYAETLPVPPGNVRKELEALDQIAAKPPATGAASDAGDPDESFDSGVVPPSELAGRQVLRSETKESDGTWSKTVDTLSVKSGRFDPSAFTPPGSFRQVPLTGAPTQVEPAYDSIGCFSNQAPVAAVGYLSGPLLTRPKLYVNYIGDSLASAYAANPGDFNVIFGGAFQAVLSSAYTAGLAQYGYSSGTIAQTQVSGGVTPVSNNFLSDEAYVGALMVNGRVPLFWWKTDSSDPLIILVVDDAQNSSTPYHLAALSPTWLLPFPVNFFAYDYIPYALTTIPHAALTVTSGILANRDQIDCGNGCDAIDALDDGTETISHEIVEAITDPYPFSGWSNPALIPPWNDGEIADICDLSCANSQRPPVDRVTRVGNTMLSTYWSNADFDCVGAWRPSIQIVSPANGTTIDWIAGGAIATGTASYQDPVTGEPWAGALVGWYVDDVIQEGNELVFPTVGSHKVHASLADPKTDYVVSDDVTVSVVDVPAQLTITSPNDGATLIQGASIQLSATVTNLDFESGAPGYLLHWLIDGVSVGTGTTLIKSVPAVGIHTVTLSFTDSAGVTQTAVRTIHVVAGSGLPFSKQIVTYNTHTCGLLPDGTAKCWGNDSWGELGDGQSLTTHVAPVSVFGFTGGVSLTAGLVSTCALVYDGTVQCWGNNAAGQLGDGTTTQRTTPVTVSNLLGATGVAAGDTHACAIVAAGAVECWGSNTNGQLGNGTTTGSSTAVVVPGLSNVVQLVAGGWSTCALIADGTVSCWGKEFFSPAHDDGVDYGPNPTWVLGLSNVRAIGAGENNICAILADSTIACWGSNAYGQLGDGTTIPQGVPEIVPNLSDVAAVAIGSEHICTLMSDSTVKCWGDGIEGQLGTGVLGGTATMIPTSVVGLSGVTAIAAGFEYTCALLIGGGATCWGSNYDGQLGNPSVPDTSLVGASTPVPVIGWP